MGPQALTTSDFDFDLPGELVAQEPPTARDGSRLLVIERDVDVTVHTTFKQFPGHLRADDLLVLNDTRVFPARLLGQRVPSGGAVECLLLARHSADDWDALVHPGQKLKLGARMVFEGRGRRLEGEVLSRHFRGRRRVRFTSSGGGNIEETIDLLGHVPLPPYIRREDNSVDRERYQTIYARERGSVAAPTAGLHFTREILDMLGSRGVELTTLTLHVGYGTFKPVTVTSVEEHIVDAEWFRVGPDAAAVLTRARRNGRRIIAVGTTTARALESLEVNEDGGIRAVDGETRLFIRPGHTFRLVDGLLTNFHLPQSSLLMLVAAFAGRDRVLSAYREAVSKEYRFYSYGDAMLIL